MRGRLPLTARLNDTLSHTGQHDGLKLSDVLFSGLGLPVPDISLEVGSGLQGTQTPKILKKYEAVLVKPGPKPYGVIVVADVNSTMARTLAAVKRGIPVVHVEEGLRKGDHSMPEEINSIVTDSSSDLLFVSDPEGLEHLKKRGDRLNKLFW